MKSSVSILLVDDHALFRESLMRLLEGEPDFHVVAQCATVAEALRCLSETRVDVVLLDYDLGQEAGTDLLKKFRNRGDIRILMVTAGMTNNTMRGALRDGVTGIVYKHSRPGQLIEAINHVAKGELWLDGGAIRSLVAATNETREPRQRSLTLTSRQREVLRNILDGLTNKEIASKIQMSETSVKAVIQELFQKAGVRTRSQLVRIAIEKHSADWLGMNR
ncbi:MAG: response regulator transcription factor [Acidobacteria bacterium]|nr:response regulator transcription factor [Acidobacteriota bacterium]